VEEGDALSDSSVKKPVLMPCGHPQEAVSYGDEGTNYCRWCEEVGRLEEQRDGYKKAYDDPEMDATEGAHPAWWRGEAYAAKKWQERCERAEAQAAALREALEHLIDEEQDGIYRHSGIPRWLTAALAADAGRTLADEVAVLVKTGVIDSRSPAGDALLDYRDRDHPMSPRGDRLEQLQFNYDQQEAYVLQLKSERDLCAGRLRDVRDRLRDEAQKSDSGAMMRAVAEKIDETLAEVT
jgi:hypothetical protein